MSRTIGVVTIINKFKVHRKNQAFQCLMIYQDLDTEYCFIKALLGKNDVEITMELLRIFTTFGAPAELHVNSCNQDLINTIVDNIKMLCPMFNIEFIRKVGDKNDAAMMVVSELHKWTEQTKKEEWEIGCALVQHTLNTTPINSNTKLSPQDRMFRSRNVEVNEQQTVVNEYIIDNLPKPLIQSEKTKEIPNSENTCILPDLETEKNQPIVVKKEIKTELEDIDLNFNNSVIQYEDGIIFPGLRHMDGAEIEVKMERLDE